ncbi:hypothetical protein JYU14_04665 [Simkania negevensis]|uniref:Uncharacterized protein n=1 Tax=Simkania negevensis TaxID=83561 RepID=A0ABS3AWM6_9BACT|nr:hypothetical protein [Simkania negevensis]
MNNCLFTINLLLTLVIKRDFFMSGSLPPVGSTNFVANGSTQNPSSNNAIQGGVQTLAAVVDKVGGAALGATATATSDEAYYSAAKILASHQKELIHMAVSGNGSDTDILAILALDSSSLEGRAAIDFARSLRLPVPGGQGYSNVNSINANRRMLTQEDRAHIRTMCVGAAKDDVILDFFGVSANSPFGQVIIVFAESCRLPLNRNNVPPLAAAADDDDDGSIQRFSPFQQGARTVKLSEGERSGILGITGGIQCREEDLSLMLVIMGFSPGSVKAEAAIAYAKQAPHGGQSRGENSNDHSTTAAAAAKSGVEDSPFATTWGSGVVLGLMDSAPLTRSGSEQGNPLLVDLNSVQKNTIETMVGSGQSDEEIIAALETSKDIILFHSVVNHISTIRAAQNSTALAAVAQVQQAAVVAHVGHVQDSPQKVLDVVIPDAAKSSPTNPAEAVSRNEVEELTSDQMGCLEMMGMAAGKPTALSLKDVCVASGIDSKSSQFPAACEYVEKLRAPAYTRYNNLRFTRAAPKIVLSLLADSDGVRQNVSNNDILSSLGFPFLEDRPYLSLSSKLALDEAVASINGFRANYASLDKDRVRELWGPGRKTVGEICEIVGRCPEDKEVVAYVEQLVSDALRAEPGASSR